MKLTNRFILVLLCSLNLTACSNFSASNLFSHYSEQNAELYSRINQGDYEQAQSLVKRDIAGDVLDNLERGRVSLLNQDNEASREWLNKSNDAVLEMQDKAVISLSQSTTSIGALAINDNLTEYEPADYELGFLHLYLALSYIRENKLDDALVEFKQANQVQENAKAIREKMLASESDKLNAQGISANLGSILARYPNATQSLSAVQNGYLFFLSGLMYETDGNINDAYIDYKRALALQPDNREIIDSVIRCATKLAANEDLSRLTAQYGNIEPMEKDQARLIVIQEQGVVSALQAWKQSLPIFNRKGQGVLYSFSLPVYPDQYRHSFQAPILNDEVLHGSLLTDVNLMARYQLHERVSSMLLRQVLRAVAKEQVRRQVSNEDPLSGLLVNVFNTLTEQPDTRSWLTLPAEIYSATQIVTAGESHLSVGRSNYEFETKPQGTTLVWVSRQGDNAVVWHKQLGSL